ncbi:MAG: hypothetical protein AVDCRST_MAG93-7749, partial [uncultured Chloroflexia bacterium]
GCNRAEERCVRHRRRARDGRGGPVRDRVAVSGTGIRPRKGARKGAQPTGPSSQEPSGVPGAARAGARRDRVYTLRPADRQEPPLRLLPGALSGPV